MVASSKATTPTLKVSNLSPDLSNDVLLLLFKGSTKVDRTPRSVRAVEGYMRGDRTLMVEDRVITIEGGTGIQDTASGKDSSDALEQRQLYIKNVPRGTTTEYLDVIFPGAKTIKKINPMTYLAEYRTGKECYQELCRSRKLRIDQHQLIVVTARDYVKGTRTSGGHGGGGGSVTTATTTSSSAAPPSAREEAEWR
ncbi:hypothetical protein Ahia01_000825400, partial [Argonauta hians]